MSEAAVLQRIRIAASAAGWRIWRNNSGAGTLDNGSFVRFGLANEPGSTVASGDLIGIRPILITPDMVGTVIGQFVSVEVKHENWKPSMSNKHEQAQHRWCDLVRSLGGMAFFSTGSIGQDDEKTNTTA